MFAKSCGSGSVMREREIDIDKVAALPAQSIVAEHQIPFAASSAGSSVARRIGAEKSPNVNKEFGIAHAANSHHKFDRLLASNSCKQTADF